MDIENLYRGSLIRRIREESRPVVVVGANHDGRPICLGIKDYGVERVGFADDRPADFPNGFCGAPVCPIEEIGDRYP